MENLREESKQKLESIRIQKDLETQQRIQAESEHEKDKQLWKLNQEFQSTQILKIKEENEDLRKNCENLKNQINFGKLADLSDINNQ